MLPRNSQHESETKSKTGDEKPAPPQESPAEESPAEEPPAAPEQVEAEIELAVMDNQEADPPILDMSPVPMDDNPEIFRDPSPVPSENL